MSWRLKCCTRHRGPVSCCALPTTLPPRAVPEQARAAVPTPVCPEDTFAVGKHNPGKTGHWMKLCWRFSRVCVKCSVPVTARATGAAGQDSSNVTDQSILCHRLQPEAPAKQKSFHISEAPSVRAFHVCPSPQMDTTAVGKAAGGASAPGEGRYSWWHGSDGMSQCCMGHLPANSRALNKRCPLLGVPRKQGKTYRFVYTHTHLSIYLPTASLFQGREIKIRF